MTSHDEGTALTTSDDAVPSGEPNSTGQPAFTGDSVAGEPAVPDVVQAADADPPPPILEPPSVSAEPAVSVTSPSAEAVIWPVRVASEWAARLLIIAAGIYVFVLMLERVSLVAFAFALALFFTAVLHPLEAKLRAATGRKTLSSSLVLLGGILVFGLVGWFVVQQITSHSAALSEQVSQVGTKLQNWLKTGPLHLKDSDYSKWITTVTNAIKDHQGQIVSSAVTTAQVALEFLGGLFLALISTFFLLRDGDLIWRWALRLIPRAARDRVDYAGERGWASLGGYIRGQVSIAVIHAVTIFIVLIALRVPLAAALAVMIFLGSFIPILGLTITGALCIAVTLLEHGVTAAIVVGVAIIALVQLEGNLLQPLIMSRAVHIHPLAVALSVAAGTTLYGITGALIAVPLVAFTNSFIRGLRNEPTDPVAESHEAEEPPPKPGRWLRRGHKEA